MAAALAPSNWINNNGTRAGGWSSQDTFPRTVGDVNGDGKGDVVGLAINTLTSRSRQGRALIRRRDGFSNMASIPLQEAGRSFDCTRVWWVT
jgi:hypothetical protein